MLSFPQPSGGAPLVCLEASVESPSSVSEALFVGKPQQSRPVKPGVVPAALVLVLAFLLASTPARNSDFWLHLATGRALVDGHGFGTEPFTFSASASYWVNPAWLFDILCFLLFQALGGTVVVVVKAGLTAAMAAFMILAGRSGRGLALPSAASALVLLAMGPWFSLKPMGVSFFFLAWTVWFLMRKTESWSAYVTSGDEPHGAGFPVDSWPLLLAFALWSNIDSWFFLGPVAVGCFLVGSLLSAKKSTAPSVISCRRWGLLFAASLGVCLFNPHHIHLLTIPFESVWSASAAQLGREASLRATFFTPFREVYGLEHAFGRLAGAAYWGLVVVSLLSFFGAVPRWDLRIIWATFFLFSCWQTQAIPFFALVAAPILAWNFASLLKRVADAPILNALRVPARALVYLALPALVVAAWPGWLQLGSFGPRGWRVEQSPALADLGEAMDRWQEAGPNSAHVFNFSPETGNYLAWVRPRARCFVNSHLHLPPESAAALVAARAALMGVHSPGTSERDWRALLRRHRATLLVVHAGSTGPLTLEQVNSGRALRYLFFGYPEECPPLFLRGDVVVFAWREDFKRTVSSAEPSSGTLLGLTRRAFAARAEPAPAAAAAATDAPRPFFWWDAFWRPRFKPSVDRDEGRTLLLLFDECAGRYRKYNHVLYAHRKTAELVTAAAPVGSPFLGYCAASAPNPPLMASVLKGLDDGPVENLYLAIRCFRRALLQDPDDFESWLLLGETYDRLSKLTRERSWGVVLGNIRQCQMTAALRRAASLKPNLWQVHERLAKVFYEIDYKDLAVKHFQETYRCRARAGPEPGESPELFHKRQDALEGTMRKSQKHVQGLRDRFDVNSINLPVVERVDMAGDLGLAGRALEILLASDIAAFGRSGLEAELKLLLNTGAPAKVKRWLTSDHRTVLGNTHYQLIRAQAEAALGNYQEAEQALREMVRLPAFESATMPPRALGAVLLGHVLLYESAGGIFRHFPWPTFRQLPSVKTLPGQLAFLQGTLHQEAESLVLQGILALEAGRTQRARAFFRRAMLFWDSQLGVSGGYPRSRTARQQVRFFLALLDKANS